MEDSFEIVVNQTFEYGEHQIAYHKSGEGRPLIMLHNGGSSHIIWKYQIEEFSSNYEVYALDLLGFGESSRPSIPLSLPLYADMLHAFIMGLKLDQPILMGNCIGGTIALEYNTLYPGKVKALCVSNVCGGSSMMRYFHPLMFNSRNEPYGNLRYKLFFWSFIQPFVNKEVVRRLYGKKGVRNDEVSERVYRGLFHPKQSLSRLMLLHGQNSFSKYDHLEPRSEKSPPTLAFWGGSNRVLPLHRGKLLLSALQPDTACIYEDSGHLLMAEEPERFNQEVRHFLARIEA